jgi:hypothetical protein
MEFVRVLKESGYNITLILNDYVVILMSLNAFPVKIPMVSGVIFAGYTLEDEKKFNL